MRGLGQIAYLAEIAQPDIAVITNIGPVHLELVETIENVARAKAEILDALPPGGIAIVPDDPLLDPYLTRDDLQVRRFGTVEEPGVFHVGERTIRLQTNLRRRTTRRISSRRSSPRMRSASRSRTASSTSTSRHSAARSSSSPVGAPDQRLLQREPRLDARRARPPRRSLAQRATAAAASPCSATWPSSAPAGRRTTARSARRFASSASTSSLRSASSRAATSRARPAPVPLGADARRGNRRRARGPPAGRRRARERLPLDGTRGRRGELRPTDVQSPASRADRDGGHDRHRPPVHQLPAPQGVRPADPRGDAGASRRQAGHADRRRRPDPAGGADRVPALTFRTLPALTVAFSPRSPAGRSGSSTTSSSSRTSARSASRAAGSCCCSR